MTRDTVLNTQADGYAQNTYDSYLLKMFTIEYRIQAIAEQGHSLDLTLRQFCLEDDIEEDVDDEVGVEYEVEDEVVDDVEEKVEVEDDV